MKNITQERIREVIRLRAVTDFGNQKKYAEHLGINTSDLSKAISGKKPPSAKMLADIGYESVITVEYKKIDKKGN